MPLSVSFSATQSIAYNNLITLLDTSTGSDGTVTSRRIFIRTASNQYLYPTQHQSSSPTYIEWPISDGGSITLDVLTESTSPEITIQWLTGAGTVVYTKTDTFCFDLQDYVFALGILSNQTSSPGVLQDQSYYSNFLQLIVNLFNAENAVVYGGDIWSSQGALNRNQVFIQNSSYFY
jgi:hypothetical protein